MAICDSFYAGCKTVADNFAIYMVLEGYSYYAVFTSVEDTVVLIVAKPVSPDTALHMVQIDELNIDCFLQKTIARICVINLLLSLCCGGPSR